MNNKIYTILYSLNVKHHHQGVFHIAKAIKIVSNNPESLDAIVKEIYVVIAAEIGISWKSVGNNIRYILKKIWENPESREYYIRLSGSSNYPTVADFLTCLIKNLK